MLLGGGLRSPSAFLVITVIRVYFCVLKLYFGIFLHISVLRDTQARVVNKVLLLFVTVRKGGVRGKAPSKD